MASALFIIGTLLFVYLVTNPLLSGKKEKKKVMGCERGCHKRSADQVIMGYRWIDFGAREHEDRLVMALDSRQKGVLWWGGVVDECGGCRVGRWLRRGLPLRSCNLRPGPGRDGREPPQRRRRIGRQVGRTDHAWEAIDASRTCSPPSDATPPPYSSARREPAGES